MKKLYSFMNRNKKPIREKFGLKVGTGNWISDEQDIRRPLNYQWEEYVNRGVA